MSRYIDADMFEAFSSNCKNYDSKSYIAGAKAVLEAIDSVPTINAVPVVHCKDCRYLGIKDLGDGYCKKKMAGIISPYDFCSYGERKEETHE